MVDHVISNISELDLAQTEPVVYHKFKHLRETVP